MPLKYNTPQAIPHFNIGDSPHTHDDRKNYLVIEVRKGFDFASVCSETLIMAADGVQENVCVYNMERRGAGQVWLTKIKQIGCNYVAKFSNPPW